MLRWWVEIFSGNLGRSEVVWLTPYGGRKKAQVCTEPVGSKDFKNIPLCCSTSGRCEQQMIGECYQIFLCRQTTLLVISTWIGDSVIYLFVCLVTSVLLRCWRILAALLLSGCGLEASTVYSCRIRFSGWCSGTCRSVLLPLYASPCPCLFWNWRIQRISLAVLSL